ncbi:hypothetical protein LZ32DRAFT_2482 [Colletotrichum eremochloae]|nr:hypothetical protein LZ32DRAFT_2482 [Colletotrichum eremochloae]
MGGRGGEGQLFRSTGNSSYHTPNSKVRKNARCAPKALNHGSRAWLCRRCRTGERLNISIQGTPSKSRLTIRFLALSATLCPVVYLDSPGCYAVSVNSGLSCNTYLMIVRIPPRSLLRKTKPKRGRGRKSRELPMPSCDSSIALFSFPVSGQHLRPCVVCV